MPTSDMSNLLYGLLIANPNGSYTKLTELTEAELDLTTTIDEPADPYDDNVIQTAIGLAGAYETTFDLRMTRQNKKALECIKYGWHCKGHIRKKMIGKALEYTSVEYCWIQKADGYFYEDVASRLGIKGGQ